LEWDIRTFLQTHNFWYTQQNSATLLKTVKGGDHTGQWSAELFFNLIKCALRIFLHINGTLFWLGITCYFLATWGQRLPGAAGAQTLDPQIPSLMP